MQKVAGGNRNRDIADMLFISEETVKVHIRHIMDKLGAKNRTQAFAIAVRRGIIELEAKVRLSDYEALVISPEQATRIRIWSAA